MYGPSTTGWLEARHIPAIADRAARRRRTPGPARDVAMPTRSTTKSSARRCSTSRSRSIPDEMVIAEPGAMMYMSSGIQMETMFGDPVEQRGLLVEGRHGRQAGPDGRIALHHHLRQSCPAARARGLRRAVPGQDPAAAPRPTGRRVDLPERIVHLRRTRHADQHRVPEEIRRRPVRRRRLHHAAAARGRHRHGPRRRHAHAAHARRRRATDASTPAAWWRCARA